MDALTDLGIGMNAATKHPAEAIHEKPVSRGGGSCAHWSF